MTLSLIMAVPNMPMSAMAAEQRAAGTIVLDFARPTTGVYSNRTVDWAGEEATLQGITGIVSTSETRTYTLTPQLAGTNWRLNVDRTIPALTEGVTKWPTNESGFKYFLWAGSECEWSKENRTVLYLYGAKTLSFDFDVEKTAEYQLSIVYYDSSSPRKLNVTVDPQSETPFATEFAVTTGGSGSGEMKLEEMAGTVVLTAGTHTVDIQNPNSNVKYETMIRAIVLTAISTSESEAVYESSTLNVEDEYNVGDTAELSVTSLFNNGEEITEGISVAYTSSKEEVATVADGVLTALAFGATAITAEVTYNGELVETLTKSVKVTVPGAFDIDFTKIDLATLDKTEEDRYYLLSTSTYLEGSDQTWSFNAEKSYKGMLNDISAKNYARIFTGDGAPRYLRLMSPNKNLVLNFDAPAAGKYDIYMTLSIYDSNGYGRVWVNDVNVGAADGFTDQAKTQKLLTAELLEGTNEITFEAYKKSNEAGNHYFSIVSVDFVPVEVATNVVTGFEATLDITEYDMTEPVTGQVAATITTTDDSIVFAEYASSNSDVVSVDRFGAVTPKKAGEATIIVKAPGMENVEFPVVVLPAETRYTITWMNVDGTVLATETYAYGEMPEYKGEEPTYEGSVFKGWGPEIAEVTGDATYTAQFVISDAKIVWLEEDGAQVGYYYVDGEVKKGAGLVKVGDYLYWVLSTGKVAVGTNRTIKANQTNGLIEAGTYYFFNNGVLATQEVKLAGEIRWSTDNKGKLIGEYYVQDELCKDVGLVELWNEEAGEETWYYVLYSGKIKKNNVADGKRVNHTVKAGKENNYPGGSGLYSFYEDGVMYDPYATETGIVKYDATGKPYYYVDGHVRKDAGLVYVQRGDLAGNYIFVTYSGTLKKGTQTVKDTKCNGHYEFVGTQKFDNNTGAMVIK